MGKQTFFPMSARHDTGEQLFCNPQKNGLRLREISTCHAVVSDYSQTIQPLSQELNLPAQRTRYRRLEALILPSSKPFHPYR